MDVLLLSLLFIDISNVTEDLENREKNIHNPTIEGNYYQYFYIIYSRLLIIFLLSRYT